MASEMVMINVSSQVKKLVEDLSHATGESQRDVVDVIFSTLEGPANEAVLEAANFMKLAAAYKVAKAREALEAAEAKAAQLT